MVWWRRSEPESTAPAAMPRLAASAGMTLAGLWLAATLLATLLLLASAGAELQADHRALEAENVAQRVLQIALVREVDELRVVDEEDEGGRADLGLRHIED